MNCRCLHLLPIGFAVSFRFFSIQFLCVVLLKCIGNCIYSRVTAAAGARTDKCLSSHVAAVAGCMAALHGLC